MIAIESVSCIVPTETASCLPVRDSFSYNKEIERMSKWQV